MKTTSIRDFRGQVSKLLDGEDAVLVTRRGKPAGILYPFTNPKMIPAEIRRELFLEMSANIAQQLDAGGVSEDDLQRDFEHFRRQRRGRQ